MHRLRRMLVFSLLSLQRSPSRLTQLQPDPNDETAVLRVSPLRPVLILVAIFIRFHSSPLRAATRTQPTPPVSLTVSLFSALLVILAQQESDRYASLHAMVRHHCLVHLHDGRDIGCRGSQVIPSSLPKVESPLPKSSRFSTRFSSEPETTIAISTQNLLPRVCTFPSRLRRLCSFLHSPGSPSSLEVQF